MRRFLLAIAALCLVLPGWASPVGGDPLLAVRPPTGTPSYSGPSSTGSAAAATSSVTPFVPGWFCSKDLLCSYKVSNATQNASGPHECKTRLCSNPSAFDEPCHCPESQALAIITPPVEIGWFCNKESKCSYKVGNATQNASGPHECGLKRCEKPESFDKPCHCPAQELTTRTTPNSTLDTWLCTEDFTCTHHPGNATQNAGGSHSCFNPRCIGAISIGKHCSCHSSSGNSTTTPRPPHPSGSAIVNPILPGFICDPRGDTCMGPSIGGIPPRHCIDARCFKTKNHGTACGCSSEIGDYNPLPEPTSNTTTTRTRQTPIPTKPIPSGTGTGPRTTTAPASTAGAPYTNCTSNHVTINPVGTGTASVTSHNITASVTSHNTTAPATNTSGRHCGQTPFAGCTPNPAISDSHSTRHVPRPTRTSPIVAAAKRTQVPCPYPLMNPKPPFNFVCPGDPKWCPQPVFNTVPPYEPRFICPEEE